MSAFPQMVGAADLAHLIGSTPRWVQKLEKQGVFTKDGRGQYPLARNLQAWAAWRVASELGKVDRSAASDHHRELRNRDLELRIAERERSLQNEAMEEGLHVVDILIGPLKSDLYALPARVTKDLNLRRVIEDELNRIFTAAANRARAIAKKEAEDHEHAK